MLKLKESQNVFLKGGDEAVILLHSFTGTVRDVKALAEFLNEAGYTCYIPAYKGHGLSLEGLLAYTTNGWWEQVQDSYHYLKDSGYETIHVLGVSLGALMSLKLVETFDVKKCIAMSTPHNRTNKDIKRRLYHYGERINQIQGLDEDESKRQLALIDDYEDGARLFTSFIEDIMNHLDAVNIPISIKYGELDQRFYQDSAEKIYHDISSEHKELTAYKNATHLMTRSDDKEQIEQDILEFLKK